MPVLLLGDRQVPDDILGDLAESRGKLEALLRLPATRESIARLERIADELERIGRLVAARRLGLAAIEGSRSLS
jgi:hypothetical protein